MLWDGACIFCTEVIIPTSYLPPRLTAGSKPIGLWGCQAKVMPATCLMAFCWLYVAGKCALELMDWPKNNYHSCIQIISYKYNSYHFMWHFRWDFRVDSNCKTTPKPFCSVLLPEEVMVSRSLLGVFTHPHVASVHQCQQPSVKGDTGCIWDRCIQ